MRDTTRTIDRRTFLQGSLLAAGAAIVTPRIALPRRETAAAKSERVTLSFWDMNGGPPRTAFWQDIIARFEKHYPNIHVEYNGLPEASADEKVSTAIAAGVPPDVADGDMSYIAGFVAQNGLLALDKYFKGSPLSKNLQASAVTSVRRTVSNNDLYGLPFSNNLDVLYYRKDWFKEKGLEPPTNWNAFYKAASVLTNPSNNVYGFGLRGGSGSIQVLQSWIFAQSGITHFFNSDGTSVFDAPAVVDVVKQCASMYGKQTSTGDLTQDYQQMVAEFDSGHSAMIFHSLGSYAENIQALGKSKVGALPMPALANGKHVLVGGRYELMYAFRGSRHPEEAYQFCAYVCSPAITNYWNKAISQIPPINGAHNEEWVKDDVAIESLNATVSEKSTVVIDPPFQLPNYSALQTDMQPYFQQVLTGSMTAAEFCSMMASEYTATLKQYNQSAHQ